MKICGVCGKTKIESEFWLRQRKNGQRVAVCCKICEKEMNNKYMRTPWGLATRMHISQKTMSKRRGHQPPAYTTKELFDWLLGQENFYDLYANWENGGYNRWDKPSIDRLDDFKGYSFDNIRLTSWKQNDIKGHLDQRNGTGTHGRSCVPIIKSTPDGEIVAKYISLAHAHEIEKIPLTVLAKTTNPVFYKNYIWRSGCND
jgi:hypothetical protein